MSEKAPSTNYIHQPINRQEAFLKYLNLEECQTELAIITGKTKAEIQKILQGKTLTEIQNLLCEKINTTIKLKISQNPQAEPELLRTFEELALFIARSPILPNNGMAFRYVEYDDIGRAEKIQWMLSVAEDSNFNTNITETIYLKEKEENILAKAALRNNPTILVLNQESQAQILTTINLTINIEKATPANFKTFQESQKNGYCEVLCIPLKGEIFNSGLLTIFSKTPFRLNCQSTINEIEAILKESCKKTQEIQEQNLYKIQGELDDLAENETEKMEQILKILIGKEGDLRCSIAERWTDPEKGEQMTKKTAGFPPHKHGKDNGWLLKKRPLLHSVFTTKEPVLVENPRTNPLTKYLNTPGGILDQYKLESLFAVPIKNKNDIVTEVIVFDSSQKNAFKKEKQEHLIKLVALIEKMINMAREMRQYRINRGERHDMRNALDILINYIFKITESIKKGEKVSTATLNILEKNAIVIEEIHSTNRNMNLIKEGKEIKISSHSSQKILQTLASSIQECNLDHCTFLKMNCSRDLKVQTNLSILKRALRNLLFNTQKHGFTSSPTESVPVQCLLTTSPEQNQLIIQITNPGLIKTENLNKIFDQGFSTKNNLLEQQFEDQHGQGLDMVKSITKALQSSVEVQCQNAEVTFLIKIPLLQSI